MGHVTAVTQLNGSFRTLRMDRVGHLFHPGNDLRTDIELPVERHATQIYRGVRYGRHSYSAACHGHMIVLQRLRRRVVARHILECCATDNTVA